MDYLAFSNVVKWMEEFSIPEIHDEIKSVQYGFLL